MATSTALQVRTKHPGYFSLLLLVLARSSTTFDPYQHACIVGILTFSRTLAPTRKGFFARLASWLGGSDDEQDAKGVEDEENAVDAEEIAVPEETAVSEETAVPEEKPVFKFRERARPESPPAAGRRFQGGDPRGRTGGGRFSGVRCWVLSLPTVFASPHDVDILL